MAVARAALLVRTALVVAAVLSRLDVVTAEPGRPLFHAAPGCPIFWEGEQHCVPDAPASFLPSDYAPPSPEATSTHDDSSDAPDNLALQDCLYALEVLQRDYYAAWLGTWPRAIDWTAAVEGTLVCGALRTSTKALKQLGVGHLSAIEENLINKYFSQAVGSYFGQNALAIRNQAYDDILWVVLGWLEAIRFNKEHSELHYDGDSAQASWSASDSPISGGGGTRHQTPPQATDSGRTTPFPSGSEWYGNAWTPTFAHRARIFWELATQGWDTKLCGGGMIWNPRLEPYKNAITNQLYIAASAFMYLYFPGDNNTSPFSQHRHHPYAAADPGDGPKDPKYLTAAIEAYKWLMDSNMTNNRGLFVDGYHISGYRWRNNTNTKCDSRDEMVYTYNQGVILTGQRGLFEATGATSYLEDGHTLIQNVIRATGYDLSRQTTIDDLSRYRPRRLPPWHGLGRAGVLEEACDVLGTCSQDSHTFKSIFFHHMSAFCEPLPPIDLPPGRTVDAAALTRAKQAHDRACAAYAPWLGRNAAAALSTRDPAGRFGMWWNADLVKAAWTADGRHEWLPDEEEVPGTPAAVRRCSREQREGKRDGGCPVDYRTYGVPRDADWGEPPEREQGRVDSDRREWLDDDGFESAQPQKPLDPDERDEAGPGPWGDWPRWGRSPADPNDRGRGRTVETQGGGLAVLRAYWELASREA